MHTFLKKLYILYVAGGEIGNFFLGGQLFYHMTIYVK